MWKTFRRCAAAILIVALCVGGSVHAQCAGYKVDYLYGYDCGVLGYSGVGFQDINDSGNACGGIGYCGAGADMIIWNGEELLLKVPLSSQFNLTALSINQHNDIAGIHQLASGQNRGFVYQDGKYHVLSPLPGHIWSEAYSIANDGRVVGFSSGAGRTMAVIWERDQPIPIELPHGPKSDARDISDSGEYICGWMGVFPSPQSGCSAFVWHNGKVSDLGFLPGATAMDARGVNNFGQVCGIAIAPSGRKGITRSAFFWSDGVLKDIGILPGPYTQCYAFDINDLGQVVGASVNDDEVGEAFIWQNGVMQALNDLIPAELELDISFVWRINNLGQITGYAGSKEWDVVGVILTPIPETPGDFNCNKVVDVDDLLGVINSWGIEGTTTADFNQDKIVDVEDLIIVLDNWTF